MDKYCELLAEHRVNMELAFQALMDALDKLDQKITAIQQKVDELLAKKRAYDFK